jgi:glutamyl-Q tRNA(Asp) synthetase
MNTRAIPPVGRFAPSPTGPLHIGSIVAAVASYLAAKHVTGGRWLLRIDDLDQPRVVPGASDIILHQLDALGLHHDGPVIHQSCRHHRYQEVLNKLQSIGATFPCSCSRKEILASAPHQGEEGPIYPGTCLLTTPISNRPLAHRVRTTDQRLSFRDLVQGDVVQDLSSDVGDFVLQRNDGIFAYQLATVVDDHDSGVNQVVRGQDLILSTPRQIYLMNLLNWPVPSYAHIPLVLTAEGEKVSKRHQHAFSFDAISPEKALIAVLHFLGFAPPAQLATGTVQTILQWGCEHFSFTALPQNSLKMSFTL